MLLSNMDLLATSPGGAARLRELILTLAVQGKLVPQDPSDEPASVLLERIRAEKNRLIKDGKVKRDKPLAPIAKEDKPFQLPRGWTFARLGNLIYSIKSGGTPSKQNPDFWGGEIPWASVKDLGMGQPIRDTQDRITKAGLEAGSALAEAGSILICTRMGLGKIGEALIDVAINQDLKAIALAPLINKQYFINFFKTLSIVGSGMTVAGIKQDELLAFVVPIPPLCEQSRIVARVEELMHLCDSIEAKGRLEAAQHAQLVNSLLGTLIDTAAPEELAENWQRIATHFDLLLDRPEAVDALEQTILQLAVRGFLSAKMPTDECVVWGSKGKCDYEIPKSWSYVQFGDVLRDLRYGTSVKCGYDTVGSPVLRIPNLRAGSIDISDLKFGPLDEREREKLELNPGDLLIVRSNGSASLVGSAALVDRELKGFAYAGYLVRARLQKNLVDPAYMALTLQTTEIREQIEGPIRTTSGVKNINSTEISRLSFALPPLAEQRRIVVRVESLRRLCSDLRQCLSARQTTQAQLADALVASLN